MKKKIWLINHYAMPPDLEPRIRTIKFAQELGNNGYDVTIISASSLHNMGTNLITDNSKFIKREYKGIKFIHIKASTYIKNDILRVINLFEFPLRLFFYGKEFEKPDIIIQTATVPFGNILYFLAKKLKAKYIVEVLDLWPESFYRTGLISRKNPILKPLYFAEKWLYKRADSIVFSMEGGKKYLIEKGWDSEHGGPINLEKVFYINNGVDLDEFNYFKDNYKLDDDDLDNDEIFKAVYIGAIRLFNNVKLLIDSAKILQEYKNFKILIYGDGTEREMLIDYVNRNNIKNVIFKEKFVEKKYIPYILSKSSLNLINYQQNGIWKYGGSQNKMFQYLASGRPICSNVKMGYCLITKNNCGISDEFSTPEEYAKAIITIVNLDDEKYNNMCLNAKQAAKSYDFKFLTKKLIDILNK